MDEVKIGADLRGNESATVARGKYGALFTRYQDILAVRRKVGFILLHSLRHFSLFSYFPCLMQDCVYICY